MRSIGVVGAGTMGRGIVQLFAQAGHAVRCYDACSGAAQGAADQVAVLWRRNVEKGRMTEAERGASMERVRPCAALEDLKDCEIVVEAIVEDLAAKTELFRALELAVAESAILATNTSSLSIAALAAGCRRAERVAGLHFFNPVPLMRVVEVIPGLRTSAATVHALETLVSGAGHTPVIAADQPGFLVNHAGRGLYTEGLRMLEERVASPAQIDTVLREAAGFRMGPFELLDLTGLDVSGKVMESIYEQFQHEPRFRPSPLVPPRIASGLLGRKSGAGWYTHDAGSDPHESSRVGWQATAPARGAAVWIEAGAADRAALAKLVCAAGGVLSEEAGRAELLLVQPWGDDATSHCAARGLDARRCVAVDPLPGLERHRTLMLTPVTAPDARAAARALLGHDGVPLTVINDSGGFIVQRVLATIVNVAADIAQRGIAAVDDIGAAVTLGLGYPFGPLAWGDRIGAARVLEILGKLQSASGDMRYRPSPWLRRRAMLGVSLLTPDAER